MNFKEKVQSMTAKEIIMAMVKSLTKPPVIRVNMDTYGEVGYTWRNLWSTPVCFGCAATNTVCEISGVKFNTENIVSGDKRSNALETDYWFLSAFEEAIDGLRRGGTRRYNTLAQEYGFASIKNNYDINLPCLDTNYSNRDLKPYIKLANAQ